MKSFNVDRNLKDKKIIRLAITKVCKNKKKRNGKPTSKYKQARRILADLDHYTDEIYNIVCDFEEKKKAERKRLPTDGLFPLCYIPSKYKSFSRRCDNGKVRDIASVPLYPDQIIHQLVIMAGQAVFMRGMYEYSCGSIPKRGVHKGKRQIRRYINRHTKQNSGAIKYVMQIDISKCYAHINHAYLKALLRAKFRGHLFYDFCCEIIDSYRENGTEENPAGLPIGYYTSQWFCNFALTPLDHFIKERLKLKCFTRYVDDMTAFGGNKKELHKAVDAIREEAKKVGVTIKDNWQVFRFDYISKKPRKGRKAPLEKEDFRKGRALDFLGFRFFRDKTILRKRIALSIRRAAATIKRAKKATVKMARAFMSRIGWLRHCNSLNFWKKYVKPFVKIKKLKEVIRNESRKQLSACCAV